jgi:hypothetical protein
MNNCVKCAKNISLEHLSVVLANCIILALLGIHLTHIFLVLGIERLLTIVERLPIYAFQSPVLVHDQLQVKSSLLAYIALEILIHL